MKTSLPRKDKELWAAYISTAIEELLAERKSYLDVRWDLKQPENCLDKKERQEIMLRIFAGVEARKKECEKAEVDHSRPNRNNSCE